MTSFFRIGLAGYSVVVFLIGLGAYVGVLPTFIAAVPHLDLLMHLILIGGVAFFLDGALRHRPLYRGRGSMGGAIVIAVAGFEEWAQRFSPRRSSTWSDFIADVIGVVLMVWLARRVTAMRVAEPEAVAQS